MFKIWAKTVRNDKIIQDYVYENRDSFDSNNLSEYLMDICPAMDVSTPIVLKKHIAHLNEFNNTTFKQPDFVEPINFDYFMLEYFN